MAQLVSQIYYTSTTEDFSCELLQFCYSQLNTYHPTALLFSFED